MMLRHICEVCGAEAVLTPEDAYAAGWDYPPKMGHFGVISPRTCPACLMTQTAYWALMFDGYTADMLTETQRSAIDRILCEPGSITVPSRD